MVDVDFENGLALSYQSSRSERDFGRLYSHYRTYILGLLSSWLGVRRDVLDDLSQDIWLQVVRNINSWDSSRGSFGSWLYVLSRNIYLMYVRSGFRRSRLLDRYHFERIGSDVVDGESVMMASVGLLDAERFLDDVLGLSPLQHRILHMRAEGCTSREIGRALGISSNSVLVSLHRLRRRALSSVSDAD